MLAAPTDPEEGTLLRLKLAAPNDPEQGAVLGKG